MGVALWKVAGRTSSLHTIFSIRTLPVLAVDIDWGWKYRRWFWPWYNYYDTTTVVIVAKSKRQQVTIPLIFKERDWFSRSIDNKRGKLLIRKWMASLNRATFDSKIQHS
jgi:hypothetical protein